MTATYHTVTTDHAAARWAIMRHALTIKTAFGASAVTTAARLAALASARELQHAAADLAALLEKEIGE